MYDTGGHVCRMGQGSHSFTDSPCTRHTPALLPPHHLAIGENIFCNGLGPGEMINVL